MLEATTGRSDQERVSPPVLRSRPRDDAVPALSPRLAPGLTMAGALLTALGGIGTWVRATSQSTASLAPEEVSSVAGYSETGGWILLVLGLLVFAAAFAWRARRARVRALAATASLVAIVFAVVRLALADSRAAEIAADASSSTGIEVFHAGYGWGAWLLLAGTVLLALGLLAGGLRELDLRRSS